MQRLNGKNCEGYKYNVPLNLTEDWQKKYYARYRKNKDCQICKMYFINWRIK